MNILKLFFSALILTMGLLYSKGPSVSEQIQAVADSKKTVPVVFVDYKMKGEEAFKIAGGTAPPSVALFSGKETPQAYKDLVKDAAAALNEKLKTTAFAAGAAEDVPVVTGATGIPKTEWEKTDFSLGCQLTVQGIYTIKDGENYIRFHTTISLYQITEKKGKKKVKKLAKTMWAFITDPVSGSAKTWEDFTAAIPPESAVEKIKTELSSNLIPNLVKKISK